MIEVSVVLIINGDMILETTVQVSLIDPLSTCLSKSLRSFRS